MPAKPVVFVVDHDLATRNAVSEVAAEMGLVCESYASGFDFLDHFDPDRHGCLVMEVRILDVSGPQIQRRLAARGVKIPVIFMAATPDVPTVVRVMREGAVHFFEKPLDAQALWEALQNAILMDRFRREEDSRREAVRRKFAALTPKESDVLRFVLEGRTNKEIARLEDVSVRTAETRRGKVMRKFGANSLVELVQIASDLNGELDGARKGDITDYSVFVGGRDLVV